MEFQLALQERDRADRQNTASKTPAQLSGSSRPPGFKGTKMEKAEAYPAWLSEH